MNELLKKLLEQREAAVKNLEEFAAPIISENRDLTADEEKRSKALNKELRRLDSHIDDARAKLARDAELAEARAAVAAATVTVRSEPKTYGEGSPNSYVNDLVRATSPAWPRHAEAVARLQRHSHELAVDAASNADEKSRVTKALREINRTENGVESRRSISEMLETRTGLDTTASSGGSFVTPVYDVADYAPFRQFGRVFIDQCHKEPLPEYGMTVYIPYVKAAAGVASQSSQGSGIQETDPTAGYLSSNLTTEAGQVTVSQQLLDRAGPNFQFDKMVFDQLQRDHAYVVNQFVINAALTGAGTSVTRSSQVTIAEVYADVASAKTQTVGASGVVLPATHLFATPTQWEWVASRVDSNNRPLIIPDQAGVFMAMTSSGGGASIAEGDTGYKMMGLRVFEDGGIPLSSTDQQMIVAHMPEVWVFEGDPVMRTVPQTLAQNLQVLLQLYSYITVIVRYPLAVQSISGAGYPGTPTF